MPDRSAVLPALALVTNALTWGLSWWPFRWLESQGVHALWATVAVYAVSVAVITLGTRGAWGVLLRTPSLWGLMFAAGMTNAAFNWAVTIGDVVRVVLLFYLMPLWAVGLARVLLHERLTALAALRVALALAGAAIVLWPEGEQSLPLPRAPAEWLGMLGGFAFALNNVMLRHEALRPRAACTLAVSLGGLAVPGVLALALYAGGWVAPPPAPGIAWLAGAAALAMVFLVGNLALQYGAARLPANVTSVIMTTEVMFASTSAVWLGAGQLTPALMAGGALIVAAAVLASLER